MTTGPFVSVVIPVFNAERHLASTLDSVLRQGHDRLEIIVVDDGSTDGSAAIAARCGGPVRCLFQPNRGPPAARNAGFRMARGELIAFLDADDLWSEDRLAVQLGLLARHPDADLVAGRFQWVRDEALPGEAPRLTPRAAPRHPLSLGTALLRRRLFTTVGELDESLRLNDDVDWYLRARELGVAMLLHEEVVLWYRRHERNITNDQERGREFYLTALKKSLDRRRAHPLDVAAPLPGWSDFTGPGAGIPRGGS
ncbi:MAG TPA: glycosyltransferase [Gemmatimonadales bacterium]